MALNDNVVFCLEMDEASGNALDASGNGYTFTDENSCGSGTGKISGSRTFNGTNQRFTRADSSGLSREGKDWSITCWFKLNSATNLDLASKSGSFPNFSFDFGRRFNGTANYLAFGILNTSGSRDPVYATNWTSSPSTGVWYFLSATYTTSTKGLTLSINAGTRNTATGSLTMGAEAADFRIGHSTVSGYFNGELDQFTLFDRAISTADEAAIYNGGSGLAYASWSPTASGKFFSLF